MPSFLVNSLLRDKSRIEFVDRAGIRAAVQKTVFSIILDTGNIISQRCSLISWNGLKIRTGPGMTLLLLYLSRHDLWGSYQAIIPVIDVQYNAFPLFRH